MSFSLVTDAVYMVLPDACSWVKTLFILSSQSSSHSPVFNPNGPFHVLVEIIWGVPALASKAKTGGLVLGGQEACPITTILTNLGHLQPVQGISIETDSLTAHAFESFWYVLLLNSCLHCPKVIFTPLGKRPSQLSQLLYHTFSVPSSSKNEIWVSSSARSCQLCPVPSAKSVSPSKQTIPLGTDVP